MVRAMLASITIFICFGPASPSLKAQLNGFNIKGDVGVKSGSQAPPGAYLGGAFYWYETDTINNSSGERINSSGTLDMFIGSPLFSFVSNKKILGAEDVVTLSIRVANSRVASPFLKGP